MSLKSQIFFLHFPARGGIGTKNPKIRESSIYFQNVGGCSTNKHSSLEIPVSANFEIIEILIKIAKKLFLDLGQSSSENCSKTRY